MGVQLPSSTGQPGLLNHEQYCREHFGEFLSLLKRQIHVGEILMKFTLIGGMLSYGS